MWAVFEGDASCQHKKAERGSGEKLPRGLVNESSCGTGGGPHGPSQIINLVNGVVPRRLAAVDATNDRGDACRAKLHERVLLEHQWPAGLQLPFRFAVQSTRGASTRQARMFLPRKGPPAGGSSAPEELDTQVPDKQGGVGFQLFTSLLLVRRGWFANHALQRTAAGRRGCNQRAPWPPSLS